MTKESLERIMQSIISSPVAITKKEQDEVLSILSLHLQVDQSETMTLDETISYCYEKALESLDNGCHKIANEYRQVANWLKELKEIRNYVDPFKSFNTHNVYLERLKEIVH